MEKNIKKECLRVYIKLNHFAVQQKLTQHYKLTILPKKSIRELQKFSRQTNVLGVRGGSYIEMTECP